MVLDGSMRAWMAVLNSEHRHDYFMRSAVCSVAMLACYALGLAAKRFAPQSAVASRPTVIYSTAHAAAVSAVAFACVSGLAPLEIWPKYGLPIAMGYFVCDTLVWVLPKMDMAMLVHHIVSVSVHISPGVPEGALISGAGDAAWALYSSAFVYLVEAAVPFLNVRWYLLATLEKHHWVYAVNNASLLVMWTAGRLGVVAYNAYTIVPRRDDFAKAGSSDIVVVFLLAHLVIFGMSAFWLQTLLKKGLKAYLYFDRNNKPVTYTSSVNQKNAEKSAADKKK